MSRQALELALEALEVAANGGGVNFYEYAKDLRQAIAEAEKQEPVEWGVDWGKDGNSVSIIKRLADGNIEVLAWEYAPHPQQRKPLTDDEIAEVAERMEASDPTDSFWRDFARAIEAAHGIKGEA